MAGGLTRRISNELSEIKGIAFLPYHDHGVARQLSSFIVLTAVVVIPFVLNVIVGFIAGLKPKIPLGLGVSSCEITSDASQAHLD